MTPVLRRGLGAGAGFAFLFLAGTGYHHSRISPRAGETAQVSAQLAETPHVAIGTALPAGGNRLFMDGHVDWIRMSQTTNRVECADVTIHIVW